MLARLGDFSNTCIHSFIVAFSLAFECLIFHWKVVGWSLKPRMTAGIVTDAPTMAGSVANLRLR